MTATRGQRIRRSLRLDRGLPARPGISWRKEMGIGAVVPFEIPDAVLAAQLHHNALNYSNVTAAICGDPLPGESMYERGPEVTIEPYDPMLNYVPYQTDILPRERLRRAEQIKSSSRNRGWRSTHPKGVETP